MHRRSRAFSLVESLVTLGVVSLVTFAVVPALHASAVTPRSAERRDAALRVARNVLVRVRAATAYDAGAVAAIAAAPPATWTASVEDPRGGAALSATVSTSSASGILSVSVALAGERVSLTAPLRVQAPPPGAVLNPSGY